MNVEPVVVVDCFTARQWLVDVCRFGKVVHKRIQRRVSQQSTNGREEEALDTILDDVCAELDRVITSGPRQVVLDLIDVVGPELRQIHRETDCRSARRSVETDQAQFGDLKRRNLF